MVCEPISKSLRSIREVLQLPSVVVESGCQMIDVRPVTAHNTHEEVITVDCLQRPFRLAQKLQIIDGLKHAVGLSNTSPIRCEIVGKTWTNSRLKQVGVQKIASSSPVREATRCVVSSRPSIERVEDFHSYRYGPGKVHIPPVRSFDPKSAVPIQ